MNSEVSRLAIVATHPIQYQAPWFRHLSQRDDLHVKIFYLWDTISTPYFDQGFQKKIVWDQPLLEGYDYAFVPNKSSTPGTSRFWVINNPTILEEIKYFHPSAILCLAYKYPSYLRLLYSNLNIPLMFRGDSHNLAVKDFKYRYLRKLIISRIFKKFTSILHVGKANKKYFRYFGVSDSKMFFCPHAVNPALFTRAALQASQDARTRLGILKTSFVLLFVGKLEEKKQPALLLEAFKELRLPDSHLIFVGDGPLEEELRQKSTDVTTVHFLNFKNQSELSTIYSMADLLVLPSRGAYETWGLVVNEAALCETPALVSDQVGSQMDLVIPGQTGYVFSAESKPSLKAEIYKAFNQRKILPEFGKNIKSLVDSYSYEAATKGLLEGIKHCTDKSHARI